MSNIITKTFDTLNDKTIGMFARLEARKQVALVGAIAMLVEMQEASAAKLSHGEWMRSQQTTKDFSALATNFTEAADTGAALVFNLIAVLGFVLVAVGLYQLYKASKDEREKPLSAVIGIVVGGMMSAAGLIAWAIRNEMFKNMGVTG